MNPYAFFFTRDHTFGTENLTVFLSICQLLQHRFQFIAADGGYVLSAPACKYFIGMMMAVIMPVMMVMIVTAAGTAFIMVVMVMVVVMRLAAALLAVVMAVVMSMLMFMAAAVTLTVMSAFMMMLMVMPVIMAAAFFSMLLIVVMGMGVFMLSGLTHQFLRHIVLLFNDLKKLCACKLAARSRHNIGVRVMLPEHRNRRLHLVGAGNIGPAQDDGAGILNLIIEKLAEILHIHTSFVHIHNSNRTVQHDFDLGSHISHRFHDI